VAQKWQNVKKISGRKISAAQGLPQLEGLAPPIHHSALPHNAGVPQHLLGWLYGAEYRQYCRIRPMYSSIFITSWFYVLFYFQWLHGSA